MPLLQQRLHFWLAGAAADALLRALSSTWRVRIIDPAGVDGPLRRKRKQIIAAFWHRHLLPLMCIYRGIKMCVPVSEHRDGEYVAHVMERYGYMAVRGSTTRGAMKLLRGMLQAAQEGWSFGITPDGPRGPRYSVQPGVFMLARRSGLPLYPIGVAVERAWIVNSWDAFVIPKPFTRITVVFDDPIMPADLETAETEQMCALLRDRLMAAGERAAASFSERWDR
jgi:lysophospholipid acyltransferase (LPLAT)-like uncharacterized protein